MLNHEDMPINKIINEKELILKKLKEQGLRITSQRKLLIDIILDSECSCCKEIYYQAVQTDSSIGIATVYRMVKTLEEIGVIDRKNMYRISLDHSCRGAEGCTIILKDNRKICLDPDYFSDVIRLGLKEMGLLEHGEIDTIVL